MNWYYLDGGKQTGPVSDAALDDLARAGAVRNDTLVWHEGLTAWQTLAAARGSAQPPKQRVPAAAETPSSNPPQGSASRFFFYPVLRALNDGKIIRKAVSVALQVVAVLWLLGGAALLVGILKIAFQLPTEGTIGALLFAVVFVVMILAIGQIYWYRAGSVRDLGESPFTVIPIVSILLRTAGEVYAALGLAVGVGGCLFIWFARTSPLGLLSGYGGILPFFPSDTSFAGGIILLVYMSVSSFLALVLFYFLAEASIVLVDVARHVRLLVEQGPNARSASR